MRKLFWSLFGKYAWDNQSEMSKPSRSPKHILAIINTRSLPKKGKVLDAGCGTGDYSIEFANSGYEVIGIDFAKGMLEKAQSKVNDDIREQIYFKQSDLNKPIEFSDEYFDCVISISVLQTVENPFNTLKELFRILKSRGTIVISLPKANSEIKVKSVTEIIKYRLKNLEKRNFMNSLFVIIKSVGDKYAKTIRWTSTEAEKLVANVGFNIISIEDDKQVLVLAEK